MSVTKVNTAVFWKHFGFEHLEPEEFKKRTTAVELGFLSAVGGVALYIALYLFRLYQFNHSGCCLRGYLFREPFGFTHH